MIPATERQVSFIESLIANREYDATDVVVADLNRAEASALIEQLRSAPYRKDNNRVTEHGIYRHENGEVYRVQPSNSGNLYAKKLNRVEGGFVYAPGAMAFLKATDKLSLEEMKIVGMQTGICCSCGRFLTDEDSVAEGIGPVCAKKYL